MELINLNKKTIKVDIVSDVVCPWCYVGKKRLEKAVNELSSEYNFDINFHPFQLDPTIPTEGLDSKTYFTKKFGSEDRMEEIFNHVESAGASVGIDFKFQEIPKAINTIALHCILERALSDGIQKEVKQALFEAYMVKPIDLTKLENIANIMTKFGWDLEKTKSTMEDEQLKYKVKQEIKQMQQLGISGVPFFIINDKYGISGAQPSEVFKQAFKSLKSEDFPITENQSCDIDGNC